MEAIARVVDLMVSTAAALNYLYSQGWELIQAAASAHEPPRTR